MIIIGIKVVKKVFNGAFSVFGEEKIRQQF